jgi:hypothetical protein
MDPIVVKYFPDVKDHLEAYSFYLKDSILRKISIICAFILIILGSFLGVVSIILRLDIIYTMLSIIFVIFGALELYGINKFKIMLACKRDPNFKNEQKIRFTDSGLDYETVGVKSKVEWNYYRSYKESDNTFILIYGKLNYAVIPKSAFCENDIEKFRELMAKNISK